jgi:hypothetical protein
MHTSVNLGHEIKLYGIYPHNTSIHSLVPQASIKLTMEICLVRTPHIHLSGQVERKYTGAYSAIKTALAAKEGAIGQQFMYEKYTLKQQQMEDYCRRNGIFVYDLDPIPMSKQKFFYVESMHCPRQEVYLVKM